MKVEWFKFQDRSIPRGIVNIWISDGIHTRYVLSDGNYDRSIYKYWAVMEFPEFPEKVPHLCIKSRNPLVQCYEDNERLYWLSEDLLMYQTEVEITYCPFCGFTKEEK